MALDFTTVGAELAYWIANITAPFSGYTGSGGQPLGERGVDIGLPYHTPVYAIVSGPVLGTGFYGGGGVVSQQADSTDSLYYQHLSDITVNPGDTVQVGQLIGYSGGQIGYGDHPATSAYSSGPHIEVGVNGPWGGMWHPLGPNVNPLPVLHAIAATPAVTTAPTGGAGTQISDFSSPSKTGGEAVTLGNTQQTQCPKPSGFDLLDPGMWTAYTACLVNTGQNIPGWLQPVADLVRGLDAIIQDPGRIVKAVVGAFFLLAGVVILILPDAAGVATAALGAPEAAPGVRAFLKKPGSVNPTRVTSNAIIQRQAEKQGARRQVRYVRQAQVAEFQAEQRRAAPGTKPLRRALPTQPLQETTPEPKKEANPFKPGTIGMTPKNPPMPETQPVSPTIMPKTKDFAFTTPPTTGQSTFRTARVERGGGSRVLDFSQQQIDAMMRRATNLMNAQRRYERNLATAQMKRDLGRPSSDFTKAEARALRRRQQSIDAQKQKDRAAQSGMDVGDFLDELRTRRPEGKS